MVTAPDPGGRIGGCDERFALVRSQESNEVFVEAFLRYGEDALNETAVRGFAQGHVSEEGVDRDQAQVARSRLVVALRFQVVEEGPDERCVEVR